MKKLRIIFIVAITSLLFNNNAIAELPENYQQLGSEQKQVILWNNIDTSHKQSPLPELKQGGFWDALKKLKGLFSLAPSFDYINDEMPENRSKIIHANGSSGKISFIAAAGQPFTGIYQTGAIGLARLSLAATPSDTSYTPGMAIKFLLPQHQSLNLHVMNALEGQGEDWNFFAKEFSNKISHPTSWVLTAVEKIFAWTRSPANDLPVDHISAWNNQGQKIAKITAPESLYFKPSINVRNLIYSKSRKDFRISLLDIPVGPLYEVYGLLKGTEYHIGTLMLDSKLFASDYGDQELFFQHQR